ncbi:DUF5752 family protein [Ectothiorhodospira mobilis]|uniref:DUF5752 family protein n=1 Tax=Ectothiorhodospira mobilis TaxID=195064 RepID=UPI001EE7DB59|nr:DUF5752 family protein [Ectothiorhodospira mobilis]MCG5536650.1 DUF5752 family protein [Ectothiorhodospira mobilis]
MAPPHTPAEFAVKDCALIALSTGRRAYGLRELREQLQEVAVNSIYHHFWGGLIQARFEEREFNNDFAAWVRHTLHDAALAERLAVLDPTDFPDLEELRAELLDLMDQRLDESEALHWMRADRSFEFIRSQIVTFDTRHRIASPQALAVLMPHLSTGSIFYHFIDARRRAPGQMDDFRAWLEAFGEEADGMRQALAGVEPYFASLGEIRQRLAEATRRALGGTVS